MDFRFVTIIVSNLSHKAEGGDADADRRRKYGP